MSGPGSRSTSESTPGSTPARPPSAWGAGRRVRAAVRLVGFLGIVAVAMVDFALRRLRGGAPLGERARATWLHVWTRRALRWFGVELSVEGAPPAGGLVVSNHLGYLDIFVLSAAAPVVFVSREDVARWPIAGRLTRMAGTVYIDRARRRDVQRVGFALVPIVDGGQPVVVFLEGTSTGGDRLLPFRPSLLAPAIERGWRVTPAFLRYEVPGGEARTEACYWGDMVFFPHFLRLLGLRRVEARVVFGAGTIAAGDRRALAARLHAEVCALAVTAGGPALDTGPEPPTTPGAAGGDGEP